MTSLLSPLEWFELLRWQDIVDILIVSYLFYRILLMARGTRAAQMMIGLFVIAVGYYIAQRFELYVLSWGMRNLLGYLFLTILVLFQPELRRILAQVGQNTYFRHFYSIEKSQVIDEVVRSAEWLSSRRIGALLVIERTVGLKSFINSGVTLDAEVSKELLSSIFISRAPLHDGAVIIKDHRVVAAACFLPLTLSSDISKELGTRHRAAIGITEETDAVVVIVSEETGSVSITVEGEITRHLSSSELKRALNNLLGPTVGSRPLKAPWNTPN
ncbi:TIGR00159 family protein [candidate division KSB3 bacterium]|uniref:Diadenylate cyclase n=1 Tax=candidate division KSB3 bacterium TaxID=2044937 RepID=A0A2G6EDF4_9BACT|nr:MAG: TIGR00159 family protein [candidate division KSB3 bacterium]PIE31040.1 MAG: TIGR00159 family protein [candidate division KSB3 bacterium]